MKQSLAAIIFFACIIIAPLAAVAWGGCPFGYTNDPYPGRCWRYIDADQDKLCDFSQLAPAERQTAVEDAAVVAAGEPNNVGSADNNEAEVTATIQSEQKGESKMTDSYHFATLAVAGAACYLISKVLVWAKWIKPTTEKKFWNVLLLIAFIGSATTGLILSMRRDAIITARLPVNFIWLHAEFSIAMAFISIYHVLWHWKYYIALVRRGKPKTE